MVYTSLVVNLIGQRSPDVIGRLSVSRDVIGCEDCKKDKTDHYNKMDTLVNDKQTYEELKRDPTPSLQRKLNSKLLDLKKTDVIDIQHYNRLRCRVPHHLNSTDYQNYTNLTYPCDP